MKNILAVMLMMLTMSCIVRSQAPNVINNVGQITWYGSNPQSGPCVWTISGNTISAPCLSGSFSGNAVSIQGTAVSSTSPTTGQCLLFNGTQYAPLACGGVTLQTNSSNNSSQTLLNLVNSDPFNGLTFTFTNSSGGIIKLGASGVLGVAGGGTGTASPGLIAGTNITITGSWPNQTINSSGGGGSGNATSIQGFAVDTTTPTNNQVLIYNTGTSKYEPTTVQFLPSCSDLELAGTSGPCLTSSGASGFVHSTRTVTGTTDTILATDVWGIVTYNNAGVVTVGLPQANTSVWITGSTIELVNYGAGAVTVNSTNSYIGPNSLASTSRVIAGSTGSGSSLVIHGCKFTSSTSSINGSFNNWEMQCF